MFYPAKKISLSDSCLATHQKISRSLVKHPEGLNLGRLMRLFQLIWYQIQSPAVPWYYGTNDAEVKT